MILFLAMMTLFIILMCCLITEDHLENTHSDSRKGSYYEICNRKD